MKRIAGFFAVSLICSVAAFAQQRGHEGGPAGSGWSNGNGRAPFAQPVPTQHAPSAPRQAPAQNFDRGNSNQQRGNYDQRGAMDQRFVSNVARPYGGQPTQYQARNDAPRNGFDQRYDARANDRRDYDRREPVYREQRGYTYQRFPMQIGPRYTYRLVGGGPARFWFGGYYFSVADYDAAACYGWDWDRDDIVLYDGPDEDGYYLAYNVRLGVYVHVLYLGR